jgi:hypothetical protein
LQKGAKQSAKIESDYRNQAILNTSCDAAIMSSMINDGSAKTSSKRGFLASNDYNFSGAPTQSINFKKNALISSLTGPSNILQLGQSQINYATSVQNSNEP